MLTTNRKLSTVWVASFALALCSGAAFGVISANGDGDPEPGGPDTYVPEVSSAGPALSEGDAIQRVVDRMNSPYIDSIRPGDQKPGSPALQIAEHADSLRDGQELAVLWEASLAQGAIADLMRDRERSLNGIVGPAEVSVTLNDGSVRTLDPEYIGGIAAGQVFPSESDGLSDQERIAAATQVLTEFGLKPEVVEVRHPLGAALAVKASIPDDVSVDWTIDNLRESLLGTPRKYEGMLMEITSPSGEPRLVGMVAFRTGLGGFWFADGQDERFGAAHGGLPDTKD